MPCFRPLVRAVDKRGNAIFYSKEDSFTQTSLYEEHNTVPCRQCYGCRMRKTMDWALRCTHELQVNEDKGAFITLTYTDETIPKDGSLVKKHFQDFMKRFRKKLPGKIRFFACGEYGDKTNRPHYHALIFGHDFPDKFLWKTHKGSKYFRSELLEKAWGLGNCIIGEVNFMTASYVAKYCQKKVTGDIADVHYTRCDHETGEVVPVLPEFQLQSNRPGIGRYWLDKYLEDVFPSDEIVHDGKKFPVPRYYYEVLEKEQPDLYDRVSMDRADARLFNDTNITIERLAYVEKVKLLQMEKKILDSESLI